MKKLKKRGPMPGDVVQSKVVLVDFGKIMFVPGRYGVVCPNTFEAGWFMVHWNGYQCHVGPDDVALVDEAQVARICPSASEAHGIRDVAKCAYCDGGTCRAGTDKRSKGGRNREDLSGGFWAE